MPNASLLLCCFTVCAIIGGIVFLIYYLTRQSNRIPPQGFQVLPPPVPPLPPSDDRKEL